jgi:hypothetical protein
MPAYHRPDTMARTLESLLSQTFHDFAVVITDDRPSPEVQAIVETYRALDSRIVYEANPSRLGMIGNWRRAYERCRAHHPGMEFFAWVSDHDICHPRWLEALVGALDANPTAVMAYPQIMRIYRRERRRKGDLGDTIGQSSRVQRLRAALTLTTAGNAIYGLFRAHELERAGVFRPVLAPDRQVLAEMALFGQFAQLQEPLWYREVAGAFSYGRQRQMFFPGRSPLHTYLPMNLQHTGVLLWDLVVQGRGRPAFGRLAGLGYAAAQLWLSTKRDLLRDDARWRVALAKTALGRWLWVQPDDGREALHGRRMWKRNYVFPGRGSEDE